MKNTIQKNKRKNRRRQLLIEKLECRRVFALDFQFNPAPGTSRQVIAGFEEAGRLWQGLFSDNVKVVVNIGERDLGRPLGETSSVTLAPLPTYAAVRNALFGDAKSVNDAVAASNLSILPSLKVYANLTSDNPNGAGSSVPYIDNDGGTNNTTMEINRANARALGLLPANDPGVDGTIEFNTVRYNFDFDRSDGITPGTTDFVFVAAHEIGHLLGFTSSVDKVDFNDGRDGRLGPFDDDSFAVNVLDLFRQSSASIAAGANLDLTADTRTKFFSLDYVTQFGSAQFSQGKYNGDGNQASHWKESSSGVRPIGFMDPTAARGEFGVVTGADLVAFDVIGWDLAIDDRFEDNNTIGKATPLGSDDTVFVSDLTIGSEDVDFFRYTAHFTGRLHVSALFRNIAGDIDIEVQDERGNVLASSRGTTDDEHIVIPVVSQQSYYVRVYGFPAFAVNKYALEIENFSVPVPTLVDLPGFADSGRHDDDNLTNVNTPTFDVYVDLGNFLDPDGDGVRFTGVPAPADFTNDAPGVYVELFDTTGGRSLGFAIPVSADFNIFRYSYLAPVALPDGVNAIQAAVRVNDGAKRFAPDSKKSLHTGRGSLSDPLLVTIDTVAPLSPFMGLDPAGSDTGIATTIATEFDRVTRETIPALIGITETNSVVEFFADGNPISPLVIDGSDIPVGQTESLATTSTPTFGIFRHQILANLNRPGLFLPADGLRQLGATAQDLAGNVSVPFFLDILVDTTAPTVTAITLPNDRSVFASKPDLRPTPATTSLVITFQGGPAADGGLSTPAVDPGLATDVRNYRLVGDQTGVVRIASAVVVGVATPEMVQVRINFSEPLADDRFTLTILDAVSDASGNRLDGESQATAPGAAAALLPSGNGLPGGAFEARFTIDSRPEIGTVTQGIAYLDINGNFQWDPQGSTHDASNRDFVLQMGTLSDAHFAGNFAPGGALSASGFDKLGVYGRFGATYSFMIDTNDDGVGDFSSVMPNDYQVNGIPVAGNFSLAHPGDEIGLFDGSSWYLDTNGNNQIDLGEKIISNFMGLPVVGDFNGDGFDDLATYNNDLNSFFFDTDRDGLFNFRWDVRDSLARFGGLGGFTDRPVAGDLNLDGIDDLGLWVKGRGGQLPLGSGEFFFWVSDRKVVNPALVFNAYSPAPLGNDLFAQLGNENALPIFGNFDPPTESNSSVPWTHNELHRTAQPMDVNGDNFISPLDALAVINVLNSSSGMSMSDPVRALATAGGNKVDVDNDWQLSPLDALAVINFLNSQSTGRSAEGESSPGPEKSFSEKMDDVFACLDGEDWLPNRRRRL